MSSLGDFDAGTTVADMFTTYRPSTGEPFTLSSGALTVYKSSATTVSTSGVSLTADFNSVTGLNRVTVNTGSATTFYTEGNFYNIVVSAGAVDSVSAVGSVVSSFTLRANSALKSTTASRTLDVSANGGAGIDWSNVELPTTVVALSNTTISTSQVVGSVTGDVGGTVTLSSTSRAAVADDVWDEVLTGATHNIAASAGRRLRTLAGGADVADGTAQAGSSNSITLAASTSFAAGTIRLNYVTIVAGTGVGQTRVIVQYDNTSKVATVNTEWSATPDATSEYVITAHADLQVIDVGTVAGVTASTITLASTAPSNDEVLDGTTVVIVSGTGKGQSRVVISYVGATRVATIAQNWDVNPDTSSGYVVLPYGRADVVGLTSAARADVRSALGMASADLDTQLDAIAADAEKGRQYLWNRRETNPSTGVETLYADDGTTPLATANIYLTTATTAPYDGTGAINRQDGLA